MVDPITPTREQIAAITGVDHRMTIAIERLFRVAGELTPEDMTALTIFAKSNRVLTWLSM